MAELLQYLDNAEKVFVFEQVYPLSAATEQANQKKLNAFGLLAKFNPFKRPKDETVLLSKHVLRYEPFWHVVTTRSVDYSRELTYPVEIGNAYAKKVLINCKEYSIAEQGNKRLINLQAVEYSHRKIHYDDYLDGLSRDLKKGVLANYINKYKMQEQTVLELPEAIVPQLRLPMLLRKIRQTLDAEVINAHEFQEDIVTVEKVYLYYRPVFAFEFTWTTEDKVGVIEVDGLTGEVLENGQWFRDTLQAITTREMLFELGSELASALLPGGGTAVRIIEKISGN
ncbi:MULTISPECIES: hypothetical protein [unclassified Janthinobacterium]|uniref:hypothetical protein n=1 Tax=unclassified Janthinobacterium TaxID=2610881 RepID=UPI0016098A8D|nr:MULTISPECIES: hypothetical protein [unclassified Janthinobacterium]MBB5370649.1 hypothetical protein [Janthinobacterium sp. K2C7]MBB5383455.1 hypothetical protein [Janthinobacterium sp. K2Li3]MBB5388909.1 hypothetical protein [Janthinobacterium sp. K2E3]